MDDSTAGGQIRRAAKVDACQGEIVKALRQVGVDVFYIGFPVDLLCGFRGRTVLLEIKDPKRGRLTAAQQEFFQTFRGKAYIVKNVAQALSAVLGCTARVRRM